MEIVVYRRYKKAEYCIGDMLIDGKWVANVLEDTDRGLDDKMKEWQIRNKKIPTRTDIPTGKYEVDMSTVSPRFSQKQFYKDVCQGKVPRLKNVKGFSGILIHVGNEHSHSDGCLLCGLNKVRGGLTDSKETFKKVYALMKEAHDRGETIYITIE